MSSISRRALWLTLLILAAGLSITQAATLRGEVRDPKGNPAAGVRVTVVESGRVDYSDAEGRFVFDNVGVGEYHLRAELPGVGNGVAEVEVTSEGADLTVALDSTTHQERIVVTASRRGRGTAELVQPVSVIDQRQIAEKLQPTLGETLRNEAGVSSSYFGAGASRPVIRGQGGGRVRILEDGVGVGDASATSPDHAVTVDPMDAEQIEILRGPSTLLYGSAAIGGVVNVIDQRIPTYRPGPGISGEANLRIGSAADERAGGVTATGMLGNVALRVGGSRRDTDDYEIPAASTLPGAGPPGDVDKLSNSDVETERWNAGGSWFIGERGHLGASVSRFETLYGVPGQGAESLRIDLEQTRGDLHTAFNLDGPFDSVDARFGGTDYRHMEIEDGEVGTIFDNQSFEGRLELRHGRRTAAWDGVVGAQFARREVDAIGDEAFLPSSRSDLAALFLLEELEHGRFTFEFGTRLERQNMSAVGSRDVDRDAWSFSFGTLWRPDEIYAVGVSVTRAERSPGIEEIYSNGPHPATRSFEIGSVNLDKEIGVGVDLSLRKTSGIVTGEVNLFANRYSDYIYAERQFVANGTPVMQDGLDVFRYVQRDAELYGGESNVVLALLHKNGHDLDLQARADLVRGRLRDRDEDLPRIPGNRFGLRLDYRGPRFSASAGVTNVDRQDRVARFERPTAGYTLVDASVGCLFIHAGVVHHVQLRGSNLTDEDARSHVSRLKEFVPLPGRDISLIYRVVF